jgi:capsular exopolysaccharide synthesis family protein
VVGDMETEIIEGPVSSQAPHNTPSRTKGIVLGAAMGLVLCMGLIVLYTILRHTVFEPSDLEKHLNMPCFGVVPLLQSKRHLNDNLATVSSTHEQGTFRESIRGIARKLENALNSHNAKVILVTSTASGEGKSVLSQNLAEIFAHWGKNVVLLDGDLRKPSLYRRFGYQQESMSLEAALSGAAPVDTVVRTRHNGKLTLILNSVPVEKPTVVIGSPAMKALIERYAAQADLVIIDTPPCGQLSDASLYQQYADGILYVVQQDRMSIHQIVEAAEAMYDSENKLLGYALNGAQQVPQGYGKYGYGKYSYGKYGGYGKYGYGKYGYGKYGNYSETDYTSETSDR